MTLVVIMVAGSGPAALEQTPSLILEFLILSLRQRDSTPRPSISEDTSRSSERCQLITYSTGTKRSLDYHILSTKHQLWILRQQEPLP